MQHEKRTYAQILAESASNTFFDCPTFEEAVAAMFPPPDGTLRWEEETKWIVSQFPHLTPDDTVLDFGCGVGRVSKALIEAYGCRVIGVDASGRMRSYAEKYVGSLRFAAVAPHDFMEMAAPFGCEPIRFTHVIIAWTLQHIIDYKPVVRFIKSMMLPKAKLLVLESKKRILPKLNDQNQITWYTDHENTLEFLTQEFSRPMFHNLNPTSDSDEVWAARFIKHDISYTRKLCMSQLPIEFSEHTLRSQIAYAEKFGYEITNFGDIQDDEHIVFLNPFCLVREDTPNLWDKYGPEFFTLLRDQDAYVSFDVLVTSGKLAKEAFSKEPNKWVESNLHLARVLDYRFNRIPIMDPLCGEDRKSSYIINYSMVRAMPNVRQVIQDDVASWEQHKPEYKYPANIALQVDGCGLGDVTCCEPVARFAREDLFPEDNFYIVSDKPELFQHLTEAPWNCKLVGNNDKVPDSYSFYRMVCFGQIQDPVQCRYIVHSQMHCVDFCSMLAYRRQIPNIRKTIKLGDYRDTVAEYDFLAKSILVHPGKHWLSKTFPAQWWEAVVLGLVTTLEDWHLTLIGKDVSEDQGVVSLLLPEHPRIHNLTNKLNLRQLIGACHVAPATLSNDSAVLHIGGAFDNWLFAVLSCKEWEYVMPYRNGTQEYKALMLNNGYVFPTTSHRPNRPEGFRLDDCTLEDVLKVLPDPAELIQKIKERLT